MATEPNTEINNVIITERTGFTATGSPMREAVVRYRVGDHGPFEWTIDAREFTPDKAKAAMQAKQRDIRATI